MTNGLLICPACRDMGKKRVLGSLSQRGDIYVQRFGQAGGTTVIRSEEYMVICQCGFGTVISHETAGRHAVYIQDVTR